MPEPREPFAHREDARSTKPRPVGRLARRVLRVVAYALAFVLLPGLVGLVGVGDVMTRLHSHAEPFEVDLAPPPHDAAKPTAVVLLSNVWTEATDFLGPYEVLAASDAYNVYAVAPERALTPLNGAVDVMPHYSIDEFEAAGLRADVMVVPYVADIGGEANRPLLDWIDRQAQAGGTILSICAGAEVVAAAGALEGRTATTIWSGVDRLASLYPGTTWLRGMRYVDDGNVVSSAGVTSGIDATFHLLRREQGEGLARAVAAELGYPHTRFLSDPAQPDDFGLWDLAPMALHGAFAWDRPALGVTVSPGVAELELAAVADTYTPAVAEVITVAEDRGPIRTANGLHVVPRHALGEAPRLDRLLVAGTGEPSAAVTAWARRQGVPVATPHADLGASGPRYAFDAITLDLARQQDAAVARATAASIEYPIDHLQLADRRPIGLIARPLLLGLLGVALLWAAERIVRARRGRRGHAARHAPLRRRPLTS